MNTIPHGSLFDRPPPRQVQSDTSIQAAASLSRKTLRGQAHAILEALSVQPNMTDEEIGTRLGLVGNTVRPRRGELVAAGLVTDSGLRKLTRSGRKAVTWIATREGREALRK